MIATLLGQSSTKKFDDCVAVTMSDVLVKADSLLVLVTVQLGHLNTLHARFSNHDLSKTCEVFSPGRSALKMFTLKVNANIVDSIGVVAQGLPSPIRLYAFELSGLREREVDQKRVAYGKGVPSDLGPISATQDGLIVAANLGIYAENVNKEGIPSGNYIKDGARYLDKYVEFKLCWDRCYSGYDYNGGFTPKTQMECWAALAANFK